MQFDENGNIIIPADGTKTITLSYDEKLEIQAIGNTCLDRSSTLKHVFVYRDSEYIQYGALSLFAAISFVSGINKSSDSVTFLKNWMTIIRNKIKFGLFRITIQHIPKRSHGIFWKQCLKEDLDLIYSQTWFMAEYARKLLQQANKINSVAHPCKFQRRIGNMYLSVF